MTTSQKLSIKLSETRQKLNELAALDSPTAENLAEIEKLRGELSATETQYRAALEAEDAETREAERTDGGGGDVSDPEMRERLELRGRARISNWFRAWTAGGRIDGAEAELSAAAGGRGGIPFDMWETAPNIVVTVNGVETRAVTPAPSTVGVSLDPIRPQVFAPSIAPRLGIDMPRVASGTYATGTITTGQTAAARAPGAAAVATAGAITVQTATPKRVSARLELRIEDIAAIGVENFEASLRENLSLALSAELDDQIINGNGTAPNLSGLFQQLADPAAPATGAPSFDKLLAVSVAEIDGLWATTLKDVNTVVNPETLRLMYRTFRDATGQDLGDKSIADYLMAYQGMLWCNERMPVSASNVAQAIVYLSGRMLEGGSMGMRTAVCPTWGEVGVDDIYTDSASGQRNYTLHVLLGDVLLVQSAAYSQVSYRLAA